MSSDNDVDAVDHPERLESRFEFEATMETSLAASSLVSGRRRLSGTAVLVAWLGIVAFSAIVGVLRLNLVIALVGALTVVVVVTVFFQIDPLTRWQLNRYFSSLLGTKVVVEVRATGITFLQGQITTALPWTSLTGVKANDEAVVFLKGKAPLGIMPGSAFDSPTSRDAFLALVRSRITSPA